MAHPEVIRLEALRKVYSMGASRVTALDDVHLSILQGDFVAIMGPSGSGKSTLMHMIGLLDTADSGRYLLDGEDVSRLDEDAIAERRARSVGFVFQQFHLLPRTTALANVALPLLYRGSSNALSDPSRLLLEVGLADREAHRPNELSGGQQQRVAIARALVNSPKVLLADEPTGNLDSSSEQEILSLLGRLNEKGITVIVVTHEEQIATRARRVIRMRDGRIVSDTRNAEIPPLPTPCEASTPLRRGFTLWWRGAKSHAEQAMKALAANKIRSGLSVLGILIGVAAVVAMLAIGRGATQSIESELSSLGSNLLVVMPGSARMMGVALEAGAVTRFTEQDAGAIGGTVPFVSRVSASVNGRVQAVFGNRNWSTSVTGAAPDYAVLHNATAILGRFFSQTELDERARVAVLGTTVVRNLFKDANPLGEFIKLNRVSFQIIGVLKPKGAQGFRDQDDTILIPLTTAMRRLLGKNYVDQIDVEVSEPQRMAEVEENVRNLILRRHHIPSSQEDGFQVRNMAEIQRALSSTSHILSALLAFIAAISLLVGGIGIMNIMMVSVTERTKEIGLRKAIGATRHDILLQFLIEAVLISAWGGAAGVLVGWGISAGVGALLGWATSVSWDAILLALLFSAGIGVAFGIWPAKKAAALRPMAALRYE